MSDPVDEGEDNVSGDDESGGRRERREAIQVRQVDIWNSLHIKRPFTIRFSGNSAALLLDVKENA